MPLVKEKKKQCIIAVQGNIFEASLFIIMCEIMDNHTTHQFLAAEASALPFDC